jgi:hypothetical protein
MQSESRYIPCPKFKELSRVKEESAGPFESTEPRGTCDLTNYPRGDGTAPGSCLYHGNADSCLRAHTDVSEKLITELGKHVESLEAGADYFKKILKESAYFPLRIISPAELVKNGMDRLAKYEGKAEITFVQGGFQSLKRVNLKKLNPRDGCLVFDEGNSSIPILGSGTAVQRVIDKDGNIPYINPEVDETYCPSNSDDIRKKCGFIAKRYSSDDN